MCLIVNLLIQNEISIFEIHRFSWKCITVLHNESDLTTLALLATLILSSALNSQHISELQISVQQLDKDTS